MTPLREIQSIMQKTLIELKGEIHNYSKDTERFKQHY